MSVPIVRRPTGGGAIWHHHEVTYALALPESHALARPSVRLYRAVHGAITGGLVGLGIGAVRQEKFFLQEIVSAADRYYALLTSVRKMSFSKVPRSWEARSVGAGGLSSNMDPSCWLDHLMAPELAGSVRCRERSADPREWSDRLVEWITKGISLCPIPSSIPEAIREQAAGREAARYRDPAWTEIR